MIIVVVVNKNNALVNLVDINPNINGRRKRKQSSEASASMPEEEEASEAYVLASHCFASFDVALHLYHC